MILTFIMPKTNRLVLHPHPQGMGIFAVDLNFRRQITRITILRLQEFLDSSISTGLLIAKLITGKDDELDAKRAALIDKLLKLKISFS